MYPYSRNKEELYPHIFIEWIEQNQNLLKSGALITDVTGVKCSIVYKVQDILAEATDAEAEAVTNFSQHFRLLGFMKNAL